MNPKLQSVVEAALKKVSMQYRVVRFSKNMYGQNDCALNYLKKEVTNCNLITRYELIAKAQGESGSISFYKFRYSENGELESQEKL